MLSPKIGLKEGVHKCALKLMGAKYPGVAQSLPLHSCLQSGQCHVGHIMLPWRPLLSSGEPASYAFYTLMQCWCKSSCIVQFPSSGF